MKLVFALVLLVISGFSVADEVTKKEFEKDGVIYIEETTKTDKMIQKKTYPKPGERKNTVTSTINEDGSVTVTSNSQLEGQKSTVSYTTSKKDNELTLKEGDLSRLTKRLPCFSEDAAKSCRSKWSSHDADSWLGRGKM